MGMLKNLDSDIELGPMKQFYVSLLAEDDTLDASNWTSEFAGRWDDDRTTDERLLRTYVVRELQIRRSNYETKSS